MHSCIYEGTVRHSRHEPVSHSFQYRLCMLYLDLAEVASLVGRGGMINNRKFASQSFLPEDHQATDIDNLDQSVRKIVQAQTGRQASGPIRMLTQLRHFGFYFSPLNLFYVFNKAETSVEFIVAEVSNTPWNERHHYVLWKGNRTSDNGELAFRHSKDFHVSPFLDMEIDYSWQLLQPAKQLAVRLQALKNGIEIFAADMSLNKLALSSAALRRAAWRYPLINLQIVAAIYYQALKLWWKKCPYYQHPEKQIHPKFPAEKSSRHLSSMPK